jgi:hypothetical protein
MDRRVGRRIAIELHMDGRHDLPAEDVDEIFSSGHFRTAGELSPHNVRVKRLHDGVLIEEGSWAFNTGAHHAHWKSWGFRLTDASERWLIAALRWSLGRE